MIMYAKVNAVEQGRLVVTDESSKQEVIVNTRSVKFQKGDRVRITYNGIMTMSLPPQISSNRIGKISPDTDEKTLDLKGKI